MTAFSTPLLDFVRDMERQGVPPFRHDSHLADDMRQSALADDARSVADHIRTTRLNRLWRIEDWLMFRKRQHPRIAAWLHQQLVAIGWRRAKA
jgi:hypothetical protein